MEGIIKLNPAITTTQQVASIASESIKASSSSETTPSSSSSSSSSSSTTDSSKNSGTQTTSTTTQQIVDQMASEIIAKGDWGVGQERADKLTAAGYDARAVQTRINGILSGK